MSDLEFLVPMYDIELGDVWDACCVGMTIGIDRTKRKVNAWDPSLH